MNNIILLGPPGAGKGTLAKFVKLEAGLTHVSTGDILREEIKNESPLGLEAKGYIEKGNLVPDELVTKLIENQLSDRSLFEKGYMLDGFPRTTAQAKDLDKILEKVNMPLDYAVYMETALDMIIWRLAIIQLI